MTATNLPPNSPGPAALTNQLRGIKPPVQIPSGWAWAMWVLGGLVLLAALVWGWSYWRKRRATAPVVPVIPAHIRAKQRLREALALIGEPKRFCISVSDTVRWYLEERFDFRAPERTTEEFLHELKSTNLLSPDQKQSLGEFLNRCDLVKFARYEPREPELHDLHDSAMRLVEETEPDIGLSAEDKQQAGSITGAPRGNSPETVDSSSIATRHSSAA